MLGTLLSALLGGSESEARPESLALAVAAILVEIARMDDDFSAAKRAVVVELLAHRFRLAPADAAQLLAAAERAEAGAADTYRFIHEVTSRTTAAERNELMEMMWEVAYADGPPDPEEEALLRRLAGLIDISDRERAEARRRVVARFPATPIAQPSL